MGKGDVDDLAIKFCLGSNAKANKTYRNVDYKDLRLKVQEEKLKIHLDRQHLKKFNSVKNKYGSTSSYNQHKEVWLKEDISIKSQIRSISAVISDQVNPLKLLCENDICEFLNTMQSEFKSFESATVQPVWQFVEDMQHWLAEKSGDNIDEITSIFDSISAQQTKIMHTLQEENLALTSELKVFDKVLQSWQFEAETITDSLLHMKFPSDQVLCEYIEEYLSVDKKYNDAYNELKDYYSVVLEKGKHGGWSQDVHQLAHHVSQQYPVDKFQRSALCLEMLKMVLPQKTEDQIKEHCEWVQLHAMYQEHKKTIKRMHETALKKLVEQADSDCKQQWTAYNEMLQKTSEQMAQKEKTAQLYKQLMKCRDEKIQKIKMEGEILEEYNKKMAKERAIMEKRKAKQRSMDQQKLHAFKELKNQKQREFDAKMKEIREKEAASRKRHISAGKKRVDYRKELHDQKVQERCYLEEQKAVEEQQKQDNLKRLAATVAVDVESDPLRVLKDTQATISRMKDSEYIGKMHLFKMVGYEDETIQGDVRLKVEKALRNAGLVNSDYGRFIMKSIKPPTEHRKDQISTVFKTDEVAK